MNDSEALFERARAVKARYESELLGRPGVVGVGVGLRQRGGAYTDEVCIVVMVHSKRPSSELPPEELLPATLEGVPVDVQEAGEIRTL